jgi:hypothetical protein
MDWQQIASLTIVVVTAVLLLRHEIARQQRAKLRVCGSDCGCSSSSTLDQLKSRTQPGYIENTVGSK